MNYIACADLHIRSNRPRYRKDDYYKSVCGKLKQIIYLCNKHKADLIIAGDIFDNIKVGHKVVNEVLLILKRLKGKCFVVAGQHDMSFHRQSLTATPLQTLIYAGRVILLNREVPYMNGNDSIYGCSFGQEPISDPIKDSMLVIHKSITPNEPPFFLPDAISAKTALKEYKEYSFIVAGDYHFPFYDHNYDQNNKHSSVIINCGPMMRASIDQIDIKPTVWLIDKLGVKPIELKVRSKESVFVIDEIAQKESLFSEELGALVEAIKNETNRPDYKETVNLIMDETKASKATRDKINSIFGSVIDQ